MRKIEEELYNLSFDKLEIILYQEGFGLQVTTFRPENAPRFRRTETDRKREKVDNKINGMLYKKTFKTINNALSYLIKIS